MLASAIASSVKSALEDNLVHSTIEENRAEYGPSFRDNLVQWFKWNRRDFPWRCPGLNPWQVLLLEMCLHRTKAEQVAQVAVDILSLGGTPDSFLDNSEALEPPLASLGLHWRTANLSVSAEFIRDKLAGRVPDNWQELVAIPGVGDYIASAVLCFAFNRPSVLMDTNTERIARRVLGESPKYSKWQLRLSLRELAGATGPDVQWNQALLDLGALVCTARAPKCGGCPVRAHCATGLCKQRKSL